MPHDLNRKYIPGDEETEIVFSGIPVGNGLYKDISPKYRTDGTQQRWNGSAWVPMGGGS